jgi:hypothetical protein
MPPDDQIDPRLIVRKGSAINIRNEPHSPINRQAHWSSW